MTENQNKKQFPKDWKAEKLGEVCEIISGKNQARLLILKGKIQFMEVAEF
jgi:restriction endonuclease S subunit